MLLTCNRHAFDMCKSLAEMDRFRSWLAKMRRAAPLCLGGALFASVLNSGGSAEGGELGANANLMADDTLPSGAGSDGIEAYGLLVGRKLLTSVGLSPFSAGFDLKGLDNNTEFEGRAVSASDSSAGFQTVVSVNGNRADCQALCA
jgi:hypothetical protein